MTKSIAEKVRWQTEYELAKHRLIESGSPKRSRPAGSDSATRWLTQIVGPRMNVYAHVSLDDKWQALDKLGDLFEEEAE